MKDLGRKIGLSLKGGEILKLIGDVGAGKTTLTKGLAEGLEITEPVQSPTFTISRVYESPSGLVLNHYDFYRLSEAGIMGDEIQEVMSGEKSVTVIEWSGAVEDVLPSDRLVIEISAVSENERQVKFTALGEKSVELLAKIETAEENL